MYQNKTTEQHILAIAIIRLHDELKEDQEWVEKMCEELGCSEYDLFNAFENLAQDHVFELEHEEE